jgi:Rod binding domain-containing protein
MAAVVTQINPTQIAAAGKTPAQALRNACNELAGNMLFGTMFRQMRESGLNSDLCESPATRMFQSQLDETLLDRSAGELGRGVGEALFRQLSQRMSGTAGTLDVRA